ncbi:hypothetical protein [Streptomyces sp. NPDC057686]|uniref:hypothetical protein n=1 Tax=Streptomyces sp. NPDC057686 TaxID=3346212 RepID=UPI003677895E
MRPTSADGTRTAARMALALRNCLAYTGVYQRRHAQSRALCTEARAHADRSGRPRMLGRVLSFAADIHLRLGRYAEAKSLLRQAVHPVEEAGDVFLCARDLTRLGTAELGEGDPGAAVALHHQALIRHQLLSPLTEPGYDWLEMDIHSRLGHAYLAAGRVHEALGQFRAVLEVPGARGHRG